jgi:hypothetical protein
MPTMKRISAEKSAICPPNFFPCSQIREVNDNFFAELAENELVNLILLVFYISCDLGTAVAFLRGKVQFK